MPACSRHIALQDLSVPLSPGWSLLVEAEAKDSEDCLMFIRFGIDQTFFSSQSAIEARSVPPWSCCFPCQLAVACVMSSLATRCNSYDHAMQKLTRPDTPAASDLVGSTKNAAAQSSIVLAGFSAQSAQKCTSTVLNSSSKKARADPSTWTSAWTNNNVQDQGSIPPVTFPFPRKHLFDAGKHADTEHTQHARHS